MRLRKYLNNQNWNIGFAYITPEELIRYKKLPEIQWMKHPYNDRFFADPFILNVDTNYICVLTEELIFEKKGTLVWLKIDRNSFKLKERKMLLKLDTHLSYPQIIRHRDSIYIIPENSESGNLTAYRLNENTISLTPIGVISEEPLTDATILTLDDGVYMLATSLPDSQENTYLYKYNPSVKAFYKVNPTPVITGSAISRMGGAFFMVNNKIYRPAQDCESGYGRALTICQIDRINPTYAEHSLFRIEPQSWRYNLGLHTLNFDAASEIAVVDSYGYLYPVMGRIAMAMHKIKHMILG